MKYLTTLLLSLFLISCSHEPTELEQVRKNGKLKVVTWNNPTCYYRDIEGPTGMEYDLASRFAGELGVQMEPVVVKDLNEAIPAMIQGKGHLAAARLMVTPERERLVRFGPIYETITQQLVYRLGTPPPRGISDLLGQQLAVASNSLEAQQLAYLKATTYPKLTWQEKEQTSQGELLSLVWENQATFTIANSNEVALTKQFFPELRTAFTFGPPVSLAWAFPKDADSSLYIAAIHFFNKIRKNGELTRLVERRYGHLSPLDFVETRRLLQHIKQRLPKYQSIFEKAAEKYGIDWRLLAAIGYQESHWNPEAVSPTGVKGIMMLTKATAEQLSLTDRIDPEQSISGGTRYYRNVKRKIPERIREPDRTWLALASYNIGFGHLEDARILTQSLGGNPDTWIDVKKHLPLLSQEKWYRKTRHGYARGFEPVRYVTNIRRYHHLLIWADLQQLPTPRTAKIKEPAIPLL